VIVQSWHCVGAEVLNVNAAAPAAAARSEMAVRMVGGVDRDEVDNRHLLALLGGNRDLGRGRGVGEGATDAGVVKERQR
jgi:hypothetical protein